MGKHTITIEIDDEAIEALRAIKARGLSQKHLLSSLVGWWSRQDPMVQMLVTGQIPEDYAGAAAKLALGRMAKGR